MTRRLLDMFTAVLPPAGSEKQAMLQALTDRQIEVLTLVGKGISNGEIARELFVEDTTVRTHIRHILEKLDLRNRVQAVVLAYDAGLVRPTSE